ncbi:MAG: helix-turn-helix domain-containing protein [Dehalococcoidia bacterium]
MTQRMTVAEAARVLGVSESTVRRRIQRGELRAMQSMGEGRGRWWVLLEEDTPAASAPETPAPEASVNSALEPTPIWSLDTARPALPRGTGWCLRHQRTYAWLKSWGAEVEFTPRFTDAFWFESRLSAERAARELDLAVDVVEVARVAA